MAEPYLPFPRRSRIRRSGGPVTVEVGARSAWWQGAGVAAVMDELGVSRMRDWHPDRRGALQCSIDRVDDVLALLEHRDGRVVEITAVDR